jgi:hypothetical protein
MPSWLRDTLDYLAKEGRVIRDAPIAFGVFVILAALLIWGAQSWKFDAQLASRDSIKRLLRHQAKKYCAGLPMSV